MINHQSVINLIYNQIDLFKADSNKQSNYLQFSSIVFDAHVFEVYCSLCSGQKLFVISSETRKQTDLLVNYIVRNRIE